jgi:choline dehydrogenase
VVDGLWGVTVSLFPYVTNGNIYAPVMMAAEKAADLILGNTPLPPQMTEYYRHQVAAPAADASSDGAGAETPEEAETPS